MSCPYSEEKLDEFEDVANPMGAACRECYECGCIHWEDCPDDCETKDRESVGCRKWEIDFAEAP